MTWYPPEAQLNRKWRYNEQSYTYRDRTGVESTTRTVKARGVTRRQMVGSHGNPVHLLGRSNLNIGGEFFSIKAEVSGGEQLSLSREIPGQAQPTVYQYDGHVWANPGVLSFLQSNSKRASPTDERNFLESKLPPPTTTAMYAAGTTAISRVAPTNPLVDLSTSVAELLREGLPSVPGSSGNAGGEYLNVQFGILPIASDIAKLRDVASRMGDLLTQYERNSGKWTRRRYNFPPSYESSSTKSGFAGPVVLGGINEGTGQQLTIGPSAMLAQPGTSSSHTSITERVWFSGAFTYHLPVSGWERKIAELDHLYGVVPGVDTLYQLTPWSWLADYFVNLGDVIENLNAFQANGLVMPYGYVMSEKIMTTQTTLEFRVWDGRAFVPKRVNDTLTLTCKRRVPATPFGFGLSPGALSAKQWSILAALGISRR